MSITLEQLQSHPDIMHEVIGKLTAEDCYKKQISHGTGVLLSDMITFYETDNPDYYQDIIRGFLSRMNKYAESGLVVIEQLGNDTGFASAVQQAPDAELEKKNIN